MASEARMTNAVASARLARGWTQQRLASITQVSRQTIIAIEKGAYEPSTSLSLKLALALDVAVEDLFALTPVVAAQVLAGRETPAPIDTAAPEEGKAQ